MHDGQKMFALGIGAVVVILLTVLILAVCMHPGPKEASMQKLEERIELLEWEVFLLGCE